MKKFTKLRVYYWGEVCNFLKFIQTHKIGQSIKSYDGGNMKVIDPLFYEI